jgi:putative membrane protein
MQPRILLITLAVGLIGVSAVSLAYAAGDAKVSRITKTFIQDASAGGLFEVESSKIAVTKATNPAVRDFAQKMIDDHSKANEDLKAAVPADAQSFIITVEEGKHNRTLDKLNKEDPNEFDEEYIEAQVEAHNETVKLFERYAENGDDPALKNFVAQTLPTLKHHQTMAKDLDEVID